MKVLILAAGLGKRMKSKYPKVMHKIMGKEMINWVIDTASKLSNEIGVVLGYRAGIVKKVIPSYVRVYIQEKQLGTAHAVMSAKEFIDPDQDLLILYGDVPFIREETLREMWKVHKESDADVTILTAIMDDPTGYGRIIRDKDGRFVKIIEEKDLTEEQRKIKEANMGFYIFKGEKLLEVLPEIKNDNAQKEYYLTDAPALLKRVSTYAIEDTFEVSGVNTRKQLIELEKEMRMRIIEKLLDDGVTIIDPETTYIHPTVKIGRDTIIYPTTFIEGSTVIGEDCEIGPMTRIKDSTIGNRVKVLRSEIYGATIEDDVSVGPYSRLREGAVLKRKVRVGNYVEVKKSTLEENVAAQHLSYIGDAFVGRNTNIGAGTITCNYDGEKKNPTFIEENVFVGSNTALVAPVRIGKDALIGAGSVITEDVPAGALALGRARQVNKEEWVYKRRNKK